MIEKITSAFKNPRKHITSSEIIRRYSSNKEDIREFALARIDLKEAHDVLDLGCGFGFMAQAVSNRVASGALIIGVDACAENLSFFLKAGKAAGRDAEFMNYHIADKLPWRDNSFDFIIASYSLYFFSGIIPEIARTLRPRGIFITITHCQDSFSGLYKAAGLSDKDTQIARLISSFSGENGMEKLKPFFDEIEAIEYDNTLNFKKESLSDLLEYARFKLPLLFSDPELHNCDANAELPPEMERSIANTLLTNGHVDIKKCDVIFRCRRPK